MTASLDVGGLAPGVNRSPNYRYFTAVPSQVFDICFDILRDKERVLVMFMVHGGVRGNGRVALGCVMAFILFLTPSDLNYVPRL